MLEELKNVILAGIGATATTYEKSAKLVDEMVKKGKLTVDEGKDLSEELKRNLKDKPAEVKAEVKPLSKEDMKDVLKEMDFATKDDLKDLKERLAKLETKAK